MAFCNSCGASLAPGIRFCNKCGAAILASSPAAATPSPAPGSVPPVASVPAPASGGSALKTILVVIGVVVLLGFLFVASLGFFAWRVAHRARIRHEGENVKVETPFGTVQTTKDPQEAARNIGVDIYPGAQVLNDGSATATFGAVHTSSLNSESTDSVDKVCNFYKPKFPNAMVMSSDANQCTIISNDKKNMITINIKAQGDKTRIVITNVSNSNAPSSSN
jgi:hypothetical protein